MKKLNWIKIESDGKVFLNYEILKISPDLKNCFCPYDTEEVRCGAWCPHFRIDIGEDEDKKEYITLCNGTKLKVDGVWDDYKPQK